MICLSARCRRTVSAFLSRTTSTSADRRRFAFWKPRGTLAEAVDRLGGLRGRLAMADFVAAIDQGTHEHAVHGLRSLRRRGRPAPTRARTDSSASGLGRARSTRKSGTARRTSSTSRWPASASLPVISRPRHHQPTRDKHRLEPQERSPVLQRDRLAGHAHRSHRARPRARQQRRGGPPPQGRSATGDLLRRRKSAMDPGNTFKAYARTPNAARWRSGPSNSRSLWNLTGGPSGGIHATDVTNASRTMLMNLEDSRLGRRVARVLRASASMLPHIRPSSTKDPYGEVATPSVCAGVPLTGVLGDQQAAMFGQCVSRPATSRTRTVLGIFRCSTPVPTSCAEPRLAHDGSVTASTGATGLRP